MLNKTKIPWADYTINPVKGLCPMACPYCYARRIYKRFGWSETIQWNEQCLIDLKRIKKPSRIFIGSTMELFGEWVGDNAIEHIFDHLRDYPQHTFIFLTKQPQNLAKWSFPPNCWVGVSATDHFMWDEALRSLERIDASVKFVSLEPLMGHISMDYPYSPKILNWLILGSQTPMSEKTLPKREWVDEIISAADKASIPVFCKEPMASHYGINRKEFPRGC